jgi:uncharacterized membrane protein YkoI
MKGLIQLLACATVLVGAGVLPLAGPALAQSVAQPDTVSGGLGAFHGDQSTLVHMLHAVEQSTGGKVIDIRFSDRGGSPGYRAVIWKAKAGTKGGDVQYVAIQAQSGQIVPIDTKNAPVWMLNWQGKADVHFARTASVSLEKAILTAEQAHNGAPAVAAGIARSASNPDSDVHAYTVLLAVDGHAKSVAVDDSTGEVIEDPGALTS